MREILFRGRWIKGDWMEGYYVVKDKVPYIVVPTEGWDGGEWFQVDPATVGQYTGLNDKNGKRIFEGDIVKFRTRKYEFNVPLCVIWREDEVCFVGAFRDCIRAYSMNKSWTYEVIGNIHDNPELMEDGAGG